MSWNGFLDRFNGSPSFVNEMKNIDIAAIPQVRFVTFMGDVICQTVYSLRLEL
jgi:hypothetical protein